MAVTNGNGHGGSISTEVLRDEASQINHAVSLIVEMTDQVSQGADVQMRSLDNALSGLNQMTVSLKDTAAQAGSVATSTENLVSAINEIAASIEQVTRSSESLTSFVKQTATAIRDDFERTMFAPRMASTIAAVIGGLTLALACLGIFGVVSYGVALRMKEIGIRVALGAPQQALLRAIVRQVLTPVGTGALVGLILAVPAGLALQGDPFYLESADPVAFASALAIFAGCGSLAALLPAVKALKADPVRMLRRE